MRFFEQLSLRTRIIALVVIPLAFAIISNASSLILHERAVGNAERARQITELEADASALVASLVNEASTVASFVFSPDANSRNRIDDLSEDVARKFADLQSKSAGHALDFELSDIKERLAERMKLVAEIVRQRAALGHPGTPGLDQRRHDAFEQLDALVRSTYEKYDIADHQAMFLAWALMRDTGRAVTLAQFDASAPQYEKARKEFLFLLPILRLMPQVGEQLAAKFKTFDALQTQWRQARDMLEATHRRFAAVVTGLERDTVKLRTSLSVSGEIALAASKAVSSRMRMIETAMLALSVVLTLAMAALLLKSVSASLRGVLADMARIRDGQLDAEVHGMDRRDELGELARGLASFRASLIERDQLSVAMAGETEQRVMRSVQVERSISTFDRSVDETMRSFHEAIVHLGSMSTTLDEAARGFAQTATHASQSVRGADEDVSSIAAATEEMGYSIGEIGRRIEQSRAATDEVVTTMHSMSASMGRLTASAAEIGDVVRLIHNIASQTNLLSLNATIEAARAGEAGRGFAVVAQEVKVLAEQTARATDSVRRLIDEVRGAAGETTERFQEIDLAVRSLADNASVIAHAIIEQKSGVDEINHNVQIASRRSQAGSQAMTDVLALAESSASTAGSMQDIARELGERAVTLRGSVQTFLGNVRAA